jgi:hypothetical protein
MRFRAVILTLVLLAVTNTVVAQERIDSLLNNRNWGKVGVQFGTSFVTSYTVTTILKNTIRCERPDGTDYNSFPSRHASIAFSAGFRISRLLYKHSPWWVVGSQTVATAIGFERVLNKRHYPSDVLAGAAIGIGSACFGNYIADLAYPSTRSRMPNATNEYQPGIEVVTSAVLPVMQLADGVSSRIGLGASMRGRLPIDDNYGFAAAVNLRSIPVYRGRDFVNPLNTLGVAAGLNGYNSVSKRYALEYTLTAGVAKMFRTDGWRHSSASFTVDADFGASMQLTKRLAAGLTAGYNMMTMPRAVSMVSVNFFTRAAL